MYPVVIFFIIIIVLAGIASVVGQILLALAVYHNAKSRCNPNPAMWGLLTGFLGWIPAVIYYVTRDSARNRLIICPQCQATHPICFAHCPQCGAQNSYAQPFLNPYTEQEAKQSKKLLIAAIVLLGASVIAFFIAFICMVAVIPPQYYSYYYY